MVRYRFDLYVRYTVEVEVQEVFKTLDQVQRRVNHDFAYVLREYIPNIEVYGSGGGFPGHSISPIRSDEDLRRHQGAAGGQGIIFEVRLPTQYNDHVQGYYQSVLNNQLSQIQHLQDQVNDLRTAGYGCQAGFSLLQQVAPVKDEQIVGVVQNYGQGIDPCVTAMVGSPSDQWTNQQGMRVLTYWGLEDPTYLMEVYRTGGFQPVVEAMRHFPEDPMIQQYAHHLVASAAPNPEYNAELHRLGVVECIIRNLNHFGNDPRVQQYGCWAMGELATSPDYRDEIVRLHGIEPLINAMMHFPKDPYVNRYAMAALQPLAMNPMWAPCIIRLDGVRAVIAALANHPNDASIAFHGITMLAELAKHEECKSKLCEAGVIPVILNLMKTYTNDYLVQESGLRCLAVLAAGNPNNQAAIYQAGGIPVVVHAVNSAIETRRNDEQIVSLIAQALNLLANLAVHPECRPQIIKCRGVECVIAALNHFHDPTILEHGLRVLAGLAGSPECIPYLVKANCIEVILSCMRKCPQDMTVQMNGCYAIGMLAGADDAKLAIARCGGIQVILASMYYHPREPHVHEQGCAALAILAELDQNKATISEVIIGEGPTQQDGMQIIASSVRSMVSYQAASKQCLKLVAVAALNETVRDGLLRCHTLESIIVDLQTYTNEASLLYYGMKAFVTLTSPQPPDAALVICGDLIDFVVRTMYHFQKDVRIQECGCEVFSIIGRFEQLQEPLIMKGAIKASCTALRNFQGDTGVQRKACRAFANMAEYAPSRAAIRQEGGIELVVTGIKYHHGHPEVGEQGCAAIANLALDEENRREVARVGGVNAVLAGLRAHTKHPGIQAYGLGALGNLAVEEDNCVVILRAGAIEMVIYAMSTWPGEARVQHFACLACSNFAHDDQNKIAIGRQGGNRMIVAAMAAHAEHAGVQEQACGALANLGINERNMVEIAQQQGIEYVVNALRRHCTHPGVQENGCFALSKFLTMPNESYKQRMHKAGAEEALSVIKDSNPSFDVRICVNVLLRRLTEGGSQTALGGGGSQMTLGGGAPAGWGGQQPAYGQQQQYAGYR